MTARVRWFWGIAFGVTWFDQVLFVMVGPAQIELDFSLL